MSDYIAQAYPLWVVELERLPATSEEDREFWLDSYAGQHDPEDWIIARIIGWKIVEGSTPQPVALAGYSEDTAVHRQYAETFEEAEALAVAMAVERSKSAQLALASLRGTASA